MQLSLIYAYADPGFRLPSASTPCRVPTELSPNVDQGGVGVDPRWF